MIVDPDVERYAAAHTSAPAEFLRALEEETRATSDAAQMLTGPLEGRFLEFLVWATGARRVIELGTFTGYGALSLAGGLPEGGRVTTVEADRERAAWARERIARSSRADRVEVLEGTAAEVVPRLEPGWDLAFVDADKTGYAAYVDLLLPRLAARGLLVLDNTLYSGRVLHPGDSEGARALAGLNDRLVADESLITVLVPLRDGVTLVRRASGSAGVT